MNKAIRSIFSDDPEVLQALRDRELFEILKELLEVKKAEASAKGLDIIKGDDGYTPVKGTDYFTPEDIEILKAHVREDVTPVKGIHYFDGEDGAPGKDADERMILTELSKLIPSTAEILSHIRVPKDGKDGSPDTARMIAKKLNSLEGVLDRKVIKDFGDYVSKEDFKKSFNNVYTKGQVDQRWHGGGLSTVSHDNTLTGSGTPSDPLSSVGSSLTIYTETPSGVIDGVNMTYTTLHIIASVFSFAINGQYIHPQDLGAGTGDYTVSGSTITFLTALPIELAGTSFTIVYK